MKTRNKKSILVLATLLLALFQISAQGNAEVGSKIKQSDINDFYYTISTSTNPPTYQRYRFYKQDGRYYFFHEKREGNSWPLKEKHITRTGTVELSQSQWDSFYEIIAGGTVTKRSEDITSGSTSASVFLYWSKDKGKIQEFTFKSYESEKQFVSLCENLIN